MCSLASQCLKPKDWWLVNMLAAVHARVAELDAPAAAELLYAAAELCCRSGTRLPSKKWVQDMSACFWAGLVHQGLPLGGETVGGDTAAVSSASASAGAVETAAGPAAAVALSAAGSASYPARVTGARAAAAAPRPLTAEQLAQGLWGAVQVGMRPDEQQWAAWEAAAAGMHWALPLDAAAQAVKAYKAAGRIMPRQLSKQLRAEKDAAEAARHAEVEAAAAARMAAARQLRAQQERMRTAAAAVAAHQSAVAGDRAGQAGKPDSQQPQQLQQPQQQPEQQAEQEAEQQDGGVAV